ncbi:MAG: ABC transporter ATP-binding protein [Verrucomicrobiales bacterium]|nr:ABC transporter ATP-binding protein [Verrucomicrobiales bacterium]
MDADRANILETKGLTKSFKTTDAPDLVVLDGIDLAVPAGSTCAIVGPSGSGKTTLLGLCAGLDQPSSGEVLIDGENILQLTEDQRAKRRNEKVGFVFQNFQLIPTLTSLENVLVPLELTGQTHKRELATQLLERVGLGDRMSHFPVQLSGGEQQRVALARAFVNRPRILFADEPTGNLDEETSDIIVEMLFALNSESGTALVIVTHDQELAEKAEQIIRMRGGKIAERS